MRFRRSVRIIKGVKLNFSGSGVSLSVGMRGLNYTIGKNGTYVNYGIPGTGMYERKKYQNSKKEESINNFNIEMDSDGYVSFYDDNWNIIYDEKIIRKIKKTYLYKLKLSQIVLKMEQKLELKGDDYVRLYKKLEKVENIQLYKDFLKELKPKKYFKLEFCETKPNINDILIKLEKEAKEKISWLYLWKRKKMIGEYLENNKDENLRREIKIWEEKKDEFIKTELRKEKEINQKYLLEYKEVKRHFEKVLNNDIDYLENLLKELLNEIELPFDYNLDYEIIENRILIDLDLPEIEDMPSEKIKVMANGTAKVKNKTKKEIKEDYYNCVIGLTMLISNKIFNKCFGIEDIIISSYTQRLNKRKNEIDDVYIYSAYIRRENFIGKDFLIDGIFEELIYEVYSRISLGPDLSLNKIEPLDTEIVELIR